MLVVCMMFVCIKNRFYEHYQLIMKHTLIFVVLGFVTDLSGTPEILNFLMIDVILLLTSHPCPRDTLFQGSGYTENREGLGTSEM